MTLRGRSIYTKLVLGFFGLLLVEVALMFLWTTLFVDDLLMDEEAIDAEAQAVFVTLALREAYATAPEVPPGENQRVQAVLERFEEFYRAEVWLTDPQDGVAYRNTEADLPVVQGQGTLHLEHINLTEVQNQAPDGGPGLYVTLPVDMDRWGKMTLHARFRNYQDTTVITRSFLLGQLLVGLIIALIIFPASRFFTAPIRRLKKAVLQYAEGRLDSRFQHKRRDEIGELGRAFNIMADNLEAMIRSGRELVANVSHELRSPLTRLRISEELLRERDEGPGRDQRLRHLDNIREEIEHLDGLIGRLLEINRLDLREAETRPEPVDLSGLSHGMAARYLAAREYRDIDFRVEVADGVEVLGSVESLASVLTNLLDNAFKYCPRGGRALLSLEGASGDTDGPGMVRLRVENTCKGLAPEELEAVFQPFRRAGSGEQQGYGLGLAIVRKIVEKHGGRVRAVNLSDGLRLEVLLPVIG